MVIREIELFVNAAAVIFFLAGVCVFLKRVG